MAYKNKQDQLDCQKRWYKKNKEKALAGNHKRKQRNREFLLNYLKDKSCEVCGMDDIRCLDFDHIDPNEKEFNISEAVGRMMGLKNIQEEISKCRIICANCHRIHTAKQFNYFKNNGVVV